MIEQNPIDTPKIQLSLCMIVKNEEKNLGSCLDSIKDIVDEMIILDTGSSDNTVQIAKSFGAEIHNFEWCNDFSAARNESIKFARGKWILWMDADEQFDNKSKEELNSILKLSQHPMGVNITIRNLSSKNESYGTAFRLFSNHCNIHFKNIIHEQVSYSLKEMSAKIIDSNITIDHYGYDEDQYDQEEKRRRNLPLLLSMADKNPNDFFPQFLLGQHCSGDTNAQEKAIYHLEKFLKMDSKETKLIASAYTTLAKIYLSKNRLNQAKINVKNSIDIAPNQKLAYYLLAKIKYAQKRFQNAIDLLEKLMTRINNLKNFKSENALDTVFGKNHIAGFLIKIMMFNLNRRKSLELIISLWKTCKDFRYMGQIFNEWDNFERDKLVLCIRDADGSNYSREILNEITGFIHLTNNDYEKALPIFQELFDQHHRNTFTVRSLAGIHAKRGHLDIAQKLLQSL